MGSYTPDLKALASKRDELVAVACDILQDAPMAERLVSSLCMLTPPQDPPVVIEMIMVNSRGASGGISRKPGNVVVNFNRFVRDFGDIGLSVAAGASEKWLIPLAALAVWKKISVHSTLELTKEQASLVYSMWLNREDGNLISREQAFEMGKLVYRLNRLAELDDDSFSQTLFDLTSFGCIELHPSGKIWLREWVKSNYP